MNVKHTEAHLRPFNLMEFAEFRRSCTREARPVQLAGSGQRPEGAPRNWVTMGAPPRGPKFRETGPGREKPAQLRPAVRGFGAGTKRRGCGGVGVARTEGCIGRGRRSRRV